MAEWYLCWWKKICGILVETILDPDLKGVIVGIGLNVNNEDFQSMKQITHKGYKISKLAIGLKTFMLIYYNLYQTNQFHKVLEYANSISYLKDQMGRIWWLWRSLFSKAIRWWFCFILLIDKEKHINR